MRGPEAKVEDAVSKFAKDLGWMAFKFSSPNHKGVPDRIFFRAGETFFIEFKAQGKEATLLQKRVHKSLQDEGFEVYVVDNTEMGKEILLSKEISNL
jgi:G:T-mismatch repair DNA endonuclease (very short patch repair protein)